MKKEIEMQRDAVLLNQILSGYDDKDSAHFIMIVQEDGTRCFLSGGDFMLMKPHLSEALAKMVDESPELDESFIDRVAMTAKLMMPLLRSYSDYYEGVKGFADP